MSRSFVPILTAIAIFTAGALSAPGSATAQDYGTPNEDFAETIFRDIINRTLEAAAEKVRGDTWGDADETWSDPDASTDGYETWSDEDSLETQRELDRLHARHDRKLAKLEEQLDRRLRKAERKFAREMRHEHRPRKVEKQRAKYEAKVDRAYAKFEDKVDAENRRFAARRDRIMSRQYMG